MDISFTRAYPPQEAPPGPALWLLFRDGELLTRASDGRAALIERVGDPARTPLYLGSLDGNPCLADDFGVDAVPEGCQFIPLRALFGQVGEAEYALAGYASQMLHWRRTSKFCPVCGHAAEAKEGDWGRRCPHCGHVAYPHISPATLILVHDGATRILLGHKAGWGARYSILAGFVEPGESLEECVRREVREEVGLDVTDLVYAGSQPWPFPHQLMVGFVARHAGGEVSVDALELDDARWFTPETLPELPPAASLSRQMINTWVDAQK